MTVDDLVWIPAQTALVGSDTQYAEKSPAREVDVDGFWIRPRQVTNAEFAAFVDATHYVTVAEQPPNPADYPDAPPENLQPGSMVFHRTPGPVDLRHLDQWWTWTPGACCSHPRGPRSSCAAASTTRWCTSPSTTPRRTPSERVSNCPRRRSGRSPRAVAWRTRPTPGATSRKELASASRTIGTASSPTCPTPATGPPGPSGVSRPTATDCTTSRATSGSGPRTGGAMIGLPNPAAQQTVTTQRSRSSRSVARSSRAARSCVPTATACATGRPSVDPRWSTPG